MSLLSGKPKKFEYIEHPADIALQVYGKTLSTLFINAAEGLYDILRPGCKVVDETFREKRKFFSNSLEDLLVLFLNEILFIAVKHHLIFTKFLINIKCAKKRSGLKCDMVGYRFGSMEREVKAVTYHKLKIEKIGDMFQTYIVFDI
ncbi:MAG: archease [Candidatus Omnitrophica bacterium]|nr:archease [Candidatus Omnitrophota bacterium]